MSEMQYMELTQKELTDLLAKYARAYYVEDAPLVEDAVYDKMYDTLVEMEKQTGIVYGNSPTARVQGECVPYLKKVKHPKPMLSCAKTKDLDEVGKFFDTGDFYHAYASIKADGCFKGDTPILMADGSYKKIIDIQVGDLVQSFDIKGELVAKPVTRVWHNGRKKLENWTRITRATGQESFSTIVTKNHQFLTKTGWKEIEKCDKVKTLRYSLSSEQEAFILGGLLGDGNFQRGNSARYRLEFFYPKKIQDSEEIFTCFDILFKDLLLKDRDYISGYGTPMRVKHINNFYHMPDYFQNANNRLNKGFTFTAEVCSHLSPLALAVYYMDDGNLQRSKQEGANVTNFHPRARLSTYRHPYSCVCEFSRYLASIGCSNNIRHEREDMGEDKGYIIEIDSNGSYKFFDIIAPYVLPSFNYKLGIRWRNIPKIKWWEQRGQLELKEEGIIHNIPKMYSGNESFASYDLEIADTHCYIANGYAVHNCTLCLTYDNGTLTQAVTRGSGIEGEDVTHNAHFISNLPKHISTLEHVELRGECVINKKQFELLCKTQDFANPRNAAAGILRRLEPIKGLTDLLSFYAFDLTFPESRFATKVSMMRWLETIGFETVIGKFCKTKEEVFDFIADVGQNKPDTPIDGCIIEYNGLDFAKSLGATAHHENRHLAFKYTDDVVETTFRGVELNTGRNGIVSITGIFDPVEIDGTVVSRASLHNVDIFRALELGIGDTITVYKANQIIPQIQDNLTRSGMYTLPNCCPCCGERLEIIKNVNTHVLNCPNPACSSKLLQRLVLFVSKDGMDIDGLGESQLAEFIDKGWLKDLYDIYWELPNHREEIRNMEGWGYTSMDNLMNAIYNSRTTDLAHFITALGIPSVGKSTAKLIAEDCEWNFETWCSKMGKGIFFDHIDSIGPATAGEIMNWFQMPTNKAILMEFSRDEAMGSFTFKVPEKKVSTTSIFSGKSFCITGTFDMGSRSDIIAQVEALGGKFIGSVSKKTDYLLAGRDCGGKLEKAKNYNIKILGEIELISILKEKK